MTRILVALHVALVTSLMLPVYGPNFNVPWLRLPWRRSWGDYGPDYIPLEEAGRLLQTNWNFLWSVVAAGLPGWLALLNFPLLCRLTGRTGERWKAYSSMILGLLSTCVLSQLLPRYGYGREWGAWVIWALSLLMLIAGTAAVARLKPPTDPLSVIRDA